MDNYSTIVLMFPIWWYTCPSIVLSFLEQGDFQGKVIIPVCTYESSGQGGCVEAIAKACPNAKLWHCIEATKLKDTAVQYITDTILRLQ